MAARFAVSHEVLEADAVCRSLSVDGAGALITFEGLVRESNRGHRVLRLEYEGYEPMILKIFEQIGAEIGEAWPGTGCGIHHRLGTLLPGDISIVIAVASAHRAAAYAASRYAIERVKQIAPIWKHEYFEGGDIWIEGAIAAADDEAAKKRAMETACA